MDFLILSMSLTLLLSLLPMPSPQLSLPSANYFRIIKNVNFLRMTNINFFSWSKRIHSMQMLLRSNRTNQQHTKKFNKNTKTLAKTRKTKRETHDSRELKEQIGMNRVKLTSIDFYFLLRHQITTEIRCKEMRKTKQNFLMEITFFTPSNVFSKYFNYETLNAINTLFF